MGKTNDVSPLFGTTFPKIFPSLLVLLVVFSICGLDKKVLGFFGIHYFSDREEKDGSYLDKGRDIIYKTGSKVSIFLVKLILWN